MLLMHPPTGIIVELSSNAILSPSFDRTSNKKPLLLCILLDLLARDLLPN
jgi:hypothetical protein